jgi:heptosyltransferase-2
MKCLIIRLGSLGDIILTTPVIKALKERYPDTVVDFLVKKEYHDLLSVNPHLNRIITLDSNGVHKGLNGLLKISKELRAGGYTHVIDLHGNLRSRMITSLLPGANTLRYDKQVVKRRLLLSGFKVKTRHTVGAYLDALLPLGIGIHKHLPNPSIYISKDEEEGAKRFLAQAGVSEAEVLVGIAPGAKWPTKRWMEDGFIDVSRKAINELGAGILIFGGPDEADLSKRVATGIGNKAISVAGVAGLKETAALIKRCKVFVSNDSGPMHIATAVGTPVVAIFGPTVQGFGFSPLGKSVVVEKELKCRPCSLHGSEICLKYHFKCMKGIPASEVFERIKEMMF